MSSKPPKSKVDQLKSLFRTHPVLRARDLEPQGIARAYLKELLDLGTISRVGRGLYSLASLRPSKYHDLLEATAAVPRGIVCLESALWFHGISKTKPEAVQMALEVHSFKPKIKFPPMQFFLFKGLSLNYGVETHRIHGVKIRVYSVAKTVADCFRHRDSVGIKVAFQALREALRTGKATEAEILRASKKRRVENVVRGYLEMLSLISKP